MSTTKHQHARSLLPVLAGCLMLGAAVLPWLNDPLGAVYPAWDLPVDIGWQVRTRLLSYGVLCLACAWLAFSHAYKHWQRLSRRQRVGTSKNLLLAGLLCLTPPLLFCLQYLCVDLHSMDVLVQHKIQFLLIQQHFLSYLPPKLLIDLQPFTVSRSTMLVRLQMLINQAGIGFYIPFVSAWLLITGHFVGTDLSCPRPCPPALHNNAQGLVGTDLSCPPALHDNTPALVGTDLSCPTGVKPRGPIHQGSDAMAGPAGRGQAPPLLYTILGQRQPCIVVAHPCGRPLLFWLACVLIALVALGRGPASLISDYQAKKALSTGDYAVATRWLDRAAFFNPALAQVSYYHIQRGQAWYFLHPGRESEDEHVYLASVYRLQGNDVGAYQELLTVQYMQPTPPYWFTTEMDLTLTHLAETIQRQNGPPIQRINFDATVLPWLQALIQSDASNVYAHYLLGRIAYDLHDYDTCLAQMASVLQFSTNNDVQSSAYTYKALSLSGQGKLAEARATLLQAEEKDPGYLNNIAREELSGLH